MPATLDEVRAAIHVAFPDADLDKIEERDSGIGGIIVSREFAGLDVSQRNQLINEKVLYPLGLRGLNVGVLYALAPRETLYD
jgi:hypothetical protein